MIPYPVLERIEEFLTNKKDGRIILHIHQGKVERVEFTDSLKVNS